MTATPASSEDRSRTVHQPRIPRSGEKIVIAHRSTSFTARQVFDEPAIALGPTPYAKWLTCRVQ